MNPRRRRHNKRARADRAWARRYQCWIVFREGLRNEVLGEALKRAEALMTKLLNDVAVPEVWLKVQPSGYVPAVTRRVKFEVQR